MEAKKTKIYGLFYMIVLNKLYIFLKVWESEEVKLAVFLWIYMCI